MPAPFSPTIATMVPGFVYFAIHLAVIAVALVYYRINDGVWYLDTTWLIVAPVWTFPFELLGSTRNLLLALGVSVIGTLVPFLLLALVFAPTQGTGAMGGVAGILVFGLIAIFGYGLLGWGFTAIAAANCSQ